MTKNQQTGKIISPVIIGIIIGSFAWLFVLGLQNIICGITPGPNLTSCIENVNFVGIFMGAILAIIYIYVNIKWVLKK